MRITCPNCGAQYEVDDALIPETGRDVQCSNCGRGWFQTKQEDEPQEAVAEAPADPHADDLRPEPDFDAESPEDEPPVTEDTFGDLEPDDDTPFEEPAAGGASDEAGERSPEPAETAAEFHEVRADDPEEEREVVEDDAPREAASEDRAEAEEEDRPEPEAPAEEPEGAPTPGVEDDEEEEFEAPGTMAPRQTDEAVLAVLREEAEREMAARRQEESGGLEIQPDLGLEDSPDHGAMAPAAAAAGAAAVASGARRDLLPDIDEINSTLRSDADRAHVSSDDDEGAVVRERRRGFRLGFGLIILIVAALISLYVLSAQIVAAVPSLEPFVIAYVDMANGVRDWFDGVLAEGVSRLSQ